MSTLGRDFFARDTVTVARELVGSTLVVDGGTVRATIVEVEAYLGQADAASHAFRGPTKRSRIMFEEAGHLYVYFSYGMHHCANVVTEAHGTAGAVLLRAAAVDEGIEVVRSRRQTTQHISDQRLLSGPGNLCRGLGLTLADNGLDLCDPTSRLHLEPGIRVDVGVGARIGISANIDAPLRFGIRDHAALSRPLR